MDNKLNDLIDWDFIPKTNSRGAKHLNFHLSVYYNPKKKSQTYTIQVHTSCPKKLKESDQVTFGRLNGNLVVTNEAKGNYYKIHKYQDSKSAQINGKALCLSIVEHFDLNKKQNQIIRLKLNPIGDESLRLWKVELYSVEPK